MNPVLYARQLTAKGRPSEAISMLRLLLEMEKPPRDALLEQAHALQALGRPQESLAVHRRIVELYPLVGAAWHDLGVTHLYLGQAPEARAAAENAIAKGFERAETWYVIGKAELMEQGLEAGERALREALRLRPVFPEAASLLSQLIWMNTGDADAAIEPVRAIREGGRLEFSLIVAETRMLKAAGRVDEALALLEALDGRRPNDPGLLRLLGQMLFETGDLDNAGNAMERALVRAPNSSWHLAGLVSVRLAQGRAAEALALARRATEVAPLDQTTWAWLSAAARAVGDPVYGQLCDYGALLRTYRLETRTGWSSLEDYLADLSAALRRLHLLKVEPSEHTLRNGTQTTESLTLSKDPVIQAFFVAIDDLIARYLEEVGEGPDPLRSRKTGSHRVSGAWSVLLKPDGYHVNHFHPHGWISSVFYVETPKAALETDERQGWTMFGQPGYSFDPPQPPERFVKPEPGLLVLFPSYMWHGTVPFTSQESRMTIAFDVLPG